MFLNNIPVDSAHPSLVANAAVIFFGSKMALPHGSAQDFSGFRDLYPRGDRFSHNYFFPM